MQSFLSQFGIVLVSATAFLLTSAASGSDMKNTLADAGLHGRVKQCVEQATYSVGTQEQTQTYTSIYSVDGYLLQRRDSQTGGEDYVSTYTYAAGRLLKTSSGIEGGEQYETTYTYDDKGHLASVTPSSSDAAVRYEYGLEQRVKRRFEQLPAFDRQPDVAVAAMPWEESDLHMATVNGGTITTTYDERERPVEAQVADAKGRITQRLVRRYDEQGRIVRDQLIPEAMEATIPDSAGTELNEAQKKALGRFLTQAWGKGESTYTYDDKGRVVEKRIKDGVEGDVVTRLRYDEHGNVTDEDTTDTPTPEMTREFSLDNAGNMMAVRKSRAEVPIQRTEIRYAYEYDAQGNWTRKTVSVRSEDGGDFKVTTISHRTLTYY